MKEPTIKDQPLKLDPDTMAAYRSAFARKGGQAILKKYGKGYFKKLRGMRKAKAVVETP